MAVKNFVFKKNWVESEVPSTKIAFFDIFEPTWTNNKAPAGPNMGLLKQNFNFQSLRKTKAILLLIMWLEHWLTRAKTYFWPNMAHKNLVLIFFICGIFCYFGLQFAFRCFYDYYFLLLNVFLLKNLKKAHW